MRSSVLGISTPRPIVAAVAGAVLAAGGVFAFTAATPAEAGAPAKRVLSTEKAPAAIGPYSQGIVAGNTVYVSGQLPIDPAIGSIDHSKSISEQTAQSIENIEAVLDAAKLDLDNVVSTTVYLDDMATFAQFNAVYAEHFGTTAAPARATVEVAELPQGAKVEISAIAVK